MSLYERIRALLGVSAYQPGPRDALRIDSPSVEAVRDALGGQLQPLPATRTRWYAEDLETAEYAADGGDLTMAAQIMRSARRDGVFAGLLSTRTDGLVRLPRRFRGRPDITEALEAGGDIGRSVFDEMCPSAELALLVGDGILLGVGVAELCPVEGRDFPVLTRLDPEFLVYRWMENRWYFRSNAGLIPIEPGNGRWILHVPGGRMAPWQHGLWRAIGRAYVRKEHAALLKDNWESKLANPARVAIAPQGGTEAQKQSWFRQVMSWGVNTVFGLTPGYDVKLLESNGKGFESFEKTIAEQNHEMIVAMAGQTVTTDGGAGFSNSDIHRSIRGDLIKATADALAYTVNTQVLPSWIAERFGEEVIETGATVEWDVAPPRDRMQDASALVSVANAVSLLRQTYGDALDESELARRFGVPLRRIEPGSAAIDTTIDDAEIVQMRREAA